MIHDEYTRFKSTNVIALSVKSVKLATLSHTQSIMPNSEFMSLVVVTKIFYGRK